MKIVKVLLWIPIAYLAYMVYGSIMDPIKFKEEKIQRYTDAIDNLMDIRKSQLAYKTINGKFAANYKSLIEFVDTAQFVLVSHRDTSYMAYDEVYRMDKLKEEIIIDTLGFVSVTDSLFKEGPTYKQMMNVPNTDGLKFELKTSTLKKNGIKIPVFVARVKKTDLLHGMDGQLVKEAIDGFDVKGEYLQVGDLNLASVSGNWPKMYESTFGKKK
ncbi:MAG: hypothetical protein KAG96_06680 [Ichthyobacteriaceae bacterium]|nr:hypothetical protein [Ichthyobacteriaceae bacterium]